MKVLEKLFTSRIRVKILEFFFFKKNSAHIRGISKGLGISSGGIKREIDNLILLGILKKKENKIVLDSECNFLEDVKNIFLKTDYLIYPLIENLKKERIDFALVFGSFAKGNFSEESDVDLLVIGKIRFSRLVKKLRNVEEETQREINPIVWSLEELEKKKNSHFGKEIFSNKFILVKGDKNEFQKLIG